MSEFRSWKSASGFISHSASDMASALTLMECTIHEKIPSAVFKVQETVESSLGEAGRELHMTLHVNDERRVDLLWGFAIPHGFTPYLRYPEQMPPYDAIFHFLGPWQMVYSHYTSSGRGETAWEATKYAARIDAGLKTPSFLSDDRRVEGFVQSHLHRLGFNIGYIDGKIGDPETMALRSLGLAGMTLEDAAMKIASIRPPSQDTSNSPYRGTVLVKGLTRAQGFGDVQAIPTNHGAAIKVSGPGRVVLDINPYAQ